MRIVSLLLLGLLVPFLASCSNQDAPPPAVDSFHYPEDRQGAGELKYISGLPVLHLEGSPDEMGAQMGLLGVKPAARLLDFTKDFLPEPGRREAWTKIVATGKAMLPGFPPEHRQEMDSAAKAADLSPDLFVAANTMFDIYKAIGCSVLMVDGSRSATGGPLFGRNLDFPTLGYLQDYSLVIVRRPTGKHAFVSVGFPGLVGCLSGMNDAGLTLAVLEVRSAKDGSPAFDPQVNSVN